VETLAGAIVGSFNNILVAHIEGGEISGTIDELIRHSVSKLAHTHFVANEEAKKRLIQMGEIDENIYLIGSPDIDIMFSQILPKKKEVFKHYKIDFKSYALVVYHPVTTEGEKTLNNVKALVDAVLGSKLNYIVIFPNNDSGSDKIIREYDRLRGNQRFKLFPSIQFRSFLVLLMNCKLIIGNSSAGIREAPIYCIPTVNIGNRQHNRFHHESIINVKEDKNAILRAINGVLKNSKRFLPCYFFGDGKSAEKFKRALDKSNFWNTKKQKQFFDRDVS
jgi:UDP-N-acetylglucosamine 2-epimerase (hydrolysing)